MCSFLLRQSGLLRMGRPGTCIWAGTRHILHEGVKVNEADNSICRYYIHESNTPLGSGVPYMVRLRPPGLGVKGGPQQRIPIATGPPPGYAASAGARSELAMDCPRGLPTFFQYGAGTSGAAPAPRVPAPGAAPAPRVPASGAGRAARVPASGAAPARPGCRAAAPGVPRRHLGCRGAAARVRAGGRSGARPPPRVPRRGTRNLRQPSLDELQP